MSATLLGPTKWGVSRGSDGHRNYTIQHLIECSSSLDGPAVVLGCPGLPAIGSTWSFDNDFDAWAFCYPDAEVTPIKTNQPNRYWTVDQKFSTKGLSRCLITLPEDPLLEPQKISGSFTKFTREVMFDRNGNLLVNSAWETFVGQLVEFDANKPNVRIEQNVSVLELDVFSQMVDTVNDAPMWGLPARCVKLSNVSWTRNIRGICEYYYTRAFDFDVDYLTFDRLLGDVATLVLNGQWDTKPGSPTRGQFVTIPIDGTTEPDPLNPSHFCRYKDKFGEACKVILNGAGLPWNGTNGVDSDGNPSNPPVRTLEHYEESNFLSLGIPVFL